MTWTVSDVMTKETGAAGRATVPKHYPKRAITITANAPLTTAASLLFEHGLPMLPVVDARHRLIGTLSRAQVLKVFLRNDETIRREVIRELRKLPDAEVGSIEVEITDGVVHLVGTVDDERVNRRIARRAAAVPGVLAAICEQRAGAPK